MREGKPFANYYRQSGNRHSQTAFGSITYIQVTEAKAKAKSLAAGQAKELQIYQEENNRLRNEIKVLKEYKEKAHRELCRVRDEQKTIGKIKVNTEL